PLIHHVERQKEAWAADPGLTTRWVGDQRPPWLPPRSVIRGLIAAPYIALLDGQRRVREIFFREEALAPLPGACLTQALPELLMEKEHNHVVTDASGTVYLVSIAALQEERSDASPGAYLALIAPLDNAFLSIFHIRTETNSIVALLHGETDRVFASNQPEEVSIGMSMEQLAGRHMIFGKRFLDYNFVVDVPIHFATLVPLSEISRISDAIVSAERQQRAMGYAVLASVSLLLVFLIARSVQHFAETMVETATDVLGLQKQRFAKGDQLLIVREQFQWMTQEIVRVRQQEEGRQRELQSANDALRHSLVMIKRTQSQLVEAEKMASLGSLVAGVAHEINTPVGTAMTAASFLAQKCQESANQFAVGTLRKSTLEEFYRDANEATQMIFSNLQRAAELIRSFKQVAVDRTTEERRLFPVREYIHHVLLSLRPHLKQTRHTVTVLCEPTLEIRSYPGVLSQIISNLLLNSLTHAFREHEEGKIIFQVMEREGDILLRYSDNGCGMEEVDRARVFEPFFTTARRRGGSGLGMYIVFNLVAQSLQGRIRCESAPGQGTTFEIEIPTRPQPTES
ncbi:MAG: HAMP domain-containing histidine kinase, partial [Magnetococcales bacterium]|nr:HAMP domain-containing histidine kinase [Magnetococcales bacterium]